MRIRILSLAGTALGLALGLTAPASAGTVNLDLSGSSCGTLATSNCLTFDNFNVYSLALLNFQAGKGDINGNDPYAVSTNGTDLRNALVIGTAPGGAQDNQSLYGTGVDNAYQTPTNDPHNPATNFATNQSAGALNSTPPTPPGAITGNTADTWDVSITTLKNFLGAGNAPVFFFNLNQNNSDPSYLNNAEDALGWMSVTLTDGATHSVTFYLDGNACTGPNPGVGGQGPSSNPLCGSLQAYNPATPLPGDNGNSNILGNVDPNHNEFAYIHGQICVEDTGPATGALLGFGACTGAGKTVDQNLGAGLAAFGLFSNALWQALSNPLDPNYCACYTDMKVDFRMAGLDNGYEQLLIYSAADIPQFVPEPMTLTFFGVGLAGLGLMRRRKKSQA